MVATNINYDFNMTLDRMNEILKVDNQQYE